MTTATLAVPAGLASWLDDHLDGAGPWRLERLTGGNSNETCLLTDADGASVGPASSAGARAVGVGAQRRPRAPGAHRARDRRCSRPATRRVL